MKNEFMSGDLANKAGHSSRVRWCFHTTSFLKGMTHERENRRFANENRVHHTRPRYDFRNNSNESASVEIAPASVSGVGGVLSGQASALRTLSSPSSVSFRSDWRSSSRSFSLAICDGVLRSSARFLFSFARSASDCFSHRSEFSKASLNLALHISGDLFWNWVVVGNQLRPDQPPVIGAKIAASYCAGSGGLDGWAALNRDWANARFPLAYKRRWNIKLFRQRRGRLSGRKIFVKVHAPMVANRYFFRNSDSLVLRKIAMRYR